MLTLRKTFLIVAVFLVFSLSFFAVSCIIVDNNDDNNTSEQINYYNNTDYTVENYIDDNYHGEVKPRETLTIYGDFAGTHKFYSKAVGINWTWGPNYFHINPNSSYDIFLDPPTY